MISSTNDVATLVEGSVREFRTKFNCSTDEALAERLVREEVAEVKEAVAHLLKELIDLTYVLENAKQALGDTQVRLSKGVREDCLRFTYLMELFSDYQMDEAFKRVHASNMLKVGNTTGDKIQKGPNYVEPDLSDLI